MGSVLAELPAARGCSRGVRAVVTLLLLGFVASLLGCGLNQGDAFVLAFRRAQRAYGAGRYQQAAALYQQAAATAIRLKDRDEAWFMRARMFERLERWRDAQRAYRPLIDRAVAGPRTARASFEYAQLEVEHGRDTLGWRLTGQAIERFPNHGSARRALTLWARHAAEMDGEGALRGQLSRWRKTLAGSELEQQLEYLSALSLARSRQLDRAHAALLGCARRHAYPSGSLTDDALMAASRVAEQQGAYRLAVADLRELLKDREVAQGGSYERPLYPLAQMRIAELERDRLGDAAAALRAFRVMYTEHRDSLLADDAMWQAALLLRKQGEPRQACDLAEALRSREPHSRYRRCVHELCSTLGAVPGERPCPAYLKRDLSAADRPAHGSS